MSYENMNNTLIPMTMCSATVSLDQFTSGWRLADFIPFVKPAPRRFEQYVIFDRPFTNIPLVHAGIAGFDIDNRDTARLAVAVEDISSDGFKLVINTWMHSRVYRVDVSWLAIGYA